MEEGETSLPRPLRIVLSMTQEAMKRYFFSGAVLASFRNFFTARL